MTPADFESVVHQHERMVFRALARLTGRADDLEDLAQEVFLRLYRGLDHFRGESQLSTYLYRIVVNVAQDEWKRRRGEAAELSLSDPDANWEDRLASPECDPEQKLGGRQLGAQLNGAMAELSAVERSVIVLFHQEDCTYEQIALALDLPINTVRTHLHRGRKRLKQSMQGRMNPCSTNTTRS